MTGTWTRTRNMDESSVLLRQHYAGAEKEGTTGDRLFFGQDPYKCGRAQRDWRRTRCFLGRRWSQVWRGLATAGHDRGSKLARVLLRPSSPYFVLVRSTYTFVSKHGIFAFLSISAFLGFASAPRPPGRGSITTTYFRLCFVSSGVFLCLTLEC